MATAITIIGIMNTIPTKPFMLPIWWMAWLAILLLAFGVPSLVARMIHVGGDEIQSALLQGSKVPDDDLLRLETSRRRTASWFPMNAPYDDLSMVSLERSARSKDTVIAKAYVTEAELWQRKALFVSPADPYGWYRLAYLFYLTDGPSERVFMAWRQSFFAAPYEPRLLVPRLQMAISLDARLDADTRGSLPRMIRDAWREDPEGLVQAARDGVFISTVEAALRNAPDDLAMFHTMLAH